ncbi:hypothetical protein HJG54_23715 [Leptolyngbya sp. NK1-12]|uniref:Organic solvent tolerance-like N-terminal domain-containing protein n=1 Tax=Leptolyngbya sp. NK1-12 TaxID=2547451 RepID=A0AA96WI36_9CYAN|nr:hypothetical protein HJG54_23715 [Leptolyngbya sp. NK1-12]
MNSRPDQPDDFSQSDTDLLIRLTTFAQTIEPAPDFKAHLETELLQAHPSNSPRTAHRETTLMNFAIPRLNRRASLVACVAIAIAAALMIPTLTSSGATRWLAALFNSTIASRANAQTIAQAIESGQITVTSDAQEYNETTQEVRAIGNVSFVYPDAQIQGSADEIQYVPTAQQVTLLGNVQISQRGENLRGTRATCSLEQRQCSLTQE